MITGSIVALVTPMHPNGQLDLPRFRQLIDWHVEQGTDALVIAGTTGESPTLTVEEHCELIRIAVEHTAKRIPVIAGSGANATQEAIELTQQAKALGAEASLQVVPYYNRPTQAGLYQHFKTIAEAVDLPVILYNVPGRTVADLHNDTILRLAQVPGVVGIKDATGQIARGLELIRLVRQTADVRGKFAVYSGDDATAMALMFAGAKGNVSVTANIAPKEMHLMCQAAIAGHVDAAIKLNDQLLPLNIDLFVEPNPVPIKWAMAHLGLIESGLRLPLVRLSLENQRRVQVALAEARIQPTQLVQPT